MQIMCHGLVKFIKTNKFQNYISINYIKGASISIGALIGALACGKLADMIGKKKTLLILAVPNIAFWCLIYLSTQMIHLYIARGIAGITGGGLFRIMAIYIGEISENHVRGALGAIFAFAMYGGMLLIFALGAFLSFFTVPLTLLPLPIISFVLMLFLPETPHFLIQKEKYDEALESLKFYRNCRDSDKIGIGKVKTELESLKTAVKNVQTNNVQLRDFGIKSFFIKFFLTDF